MTKDTKETPLPKFQPLLSFLSHFRLFGSINFFSVLPSLHCFYIVILKQHQRCLFLIFTRESLSLKLKNTLCAADAVLESSTRTLTCFTIHLNLWKKLYELYMNKKCFWRAAVTLLMQRSPFASCQSWCSHSAKKKSKESLKSLCSPKKEGDNAQDGEVVSSFSPSRGRYHLHPAGLWLPCPAW